MNVNEPVLKVENLKQYFKLGGAELKAVDGVSFAINKGEVLGLVGESGCGKTTTGRTIIRLYDATDGNVWLNGRRFAAGVRTQKAEIKAAKKSMRGEALRSFLAAKKAEIASAKEDVKSAAKERLSTKIQMIFQDPVGSLDPRMTVRDLIAEGLVIKGVKDKAYIDEEVFRVLETVGLVREHANRYPHEFSGGQRQRIGIARAIILKPEILIADEPVSALDVSIQAQVITLLNELREKIGLTILFIAHNLSVVKYFSDKIAVMYYGKIMEMADTKELFARPMHPYTRALLSAVPYPDPNYEKQRKRILYDPILAHDYREHKPALIEITPGHTVYGSEPEISAYKQEYNL